MSGLFTRCCKYIANRPLGTTQQSPPRNAEPNAFTPPQRPASSATAVVAVICIAIKRSIMEGLERKSRLRRVKPALAALIPQPKPTIIWGIEDSRQTVTRSSIGKSCYLSAKFRIYAHGLSFLPTAVVENRCGAHPASAPKRLVIPSNWSRLPKAMTTSPAFRALILMLTEVASASDKASSSLSKSRDFSAFEAVLLLC